MIFADTGWFVALVNTDDELHQRAKRWLKALPAKVVTTEFVFVETYDGLSPPNSRIRCHELISQLIANLALTVVPVNERKWLDRGLRLHQDRPDKAWSLTDCISFALMQERGITAALAHDHHFEQAGFEALLRRDPE